ncbi:MAG: nucleotidyl transferase AbiEii/AbiGii toxin family protein [Deltaproteobacteria bacterium]|nr:nucleotidyl transferase AbiEii/AbiGii toxin family protein [Deltaproteobacteria bacterium]
MSLDLIRSKLANYNPSTRQEELNAIAEISQELALAALAKSDFFSKAAFQGGTCLRIIHGIQRFSEDLDFISIGHEDFRWEKYLKDVKNLFESFSLEVQIKDRSQTDAVVRKAFIKQDSFGKVLDLSFPSNISDRQNIRIKFEIDTNPPTESRFQTHYLSFPYPHSVLTQDVPSLFASKCLAILGRKYDKGRDWFDLTWYFSMKSKVNYDFLSRGVEQIEGKKTGNLNLDAKWLRKALLQKIDQVPWEETKDDISRFLRAQDQHVLKVWGIEYFRGVVDSYFSTIGS